MNNDVLKISNLYDLNETIAAKVFEGCTYPWEVLAKIGDFIVELGNSIHCQKMNMRSVGRIYGFTELQMYFHQLILQDLQLSVKMPR